MERFLAPSGRGSVFLSTATLWEIAIKMGLKKLALSSSYAVFIIRALFGYGITVLPISLDDCAAYEPLPFSDPRHRDPFDRMIVTHALSYGLSVVGNDAAFDGYGVSRLW